MSALIKCKLNNYEVEIAFIIKANRWRMLHFITKMPKEVYITKSLFAIHITNEFHRIDKMWSCKCHKTWHSHAHCFICWHTEFFLKCMTMESSQNLRFWQWMKWKLSLNQRWKLKTTAARFWNDIGFLSQKWKNLISFSWHLMSHWLNVLLWDFGSWRQQLFSKWNR